MQFSPPAYRVPFRFEPGEGERSHRLVNVGAEPVYDVQFTLHGGGLMLATEPAMVGAGHGIEVTIAASDLTAAILVVRWCRNDGVEYVWRVNI